MNKTETINLAGIVFHIDDLAFQELSQYLISIRRHFENSPGRDEIIMDIEGRMAEIFQGKITDKKQVITLDDVNEAIGILGRPQDFHDEEPEQDEKNAGQNENRKRRRLYRDPDERVLGGVCSGMGYYFDIDPVWFRIGFIGTFFFSGPLIYLVAWFIIPLARTTSERLDMKGERVNISNIEKSINDEFKHIKNRFRRVRDDMKQKMYDKNVKENIRRKSSRFGEFMEELFSHGLRGLVLFFGIIMLAIGVAMLISFIISLTASSAVFMSSGFGWEIVSLPSFLSVFVTSVSQANLAIIGLMIVVGIPLLAIIWGSVRLVFGIHNKIKAIRYISSAIWFAGFMLLAYVSVHTLIDFKENAVVRNYFDIREPASDILYVQAIEQCPNIKEPEENISIHGWNAFISNDIKTAYIKPFIDIKKSESEHFEIQVIRSANARTYDEARRRASALKPDIMQNDSLIVLEKCIPIINDLKWRKQEVIIEFYVPVGKSIQFDQSWEGIRMTENGDQNTFELDRPGRIWKMTDTGLRCLNGRDTIPEVQPAISD
ncbi:MAG: PspC domain-containing protein [Bacteroidetes bacterium]|nr:PspC domain-containing protein [Bacteroidota bacterium]MBU1721089.1 PspC domain-containing protein [Bacteroidota bacterium]